MIINKFAGKKILITGTSKGIGSALVEFLFLSMRIFMRYRDQKPYVRIREYIVYKRI